MPSSTPRRFLAFAGAVILLAAAYALTGRLGQASAIPPGHITLIWPASGIALAALLIYGNRMWPGVWIGSFLVNNWVSFERMHAGASTNAMLASALIATGASAGALFGAEALRRTSKDEQYLDGTLDVTRFLVLGAMVSCLVSPTVGVSSLCFFGIQSWAEFGSGWWTWWLGDTVGVLVLTPLLLTWRHPAIFGGTARRVGELVAVLVALLVALLVCSGAAFWGRYPVVYAVVPVLVWIAFRFGRHGATAANLIVSSIAILGTIDGFGPFARQTLTVEESLFMAQLFLGVVVMTTLLLAAALAERYRVEEELRVSGANLARENIERHDALLALRTAREDLEDRVRERTAELAASNAALNEAKSLAERASQAKSTFLANMSHELRTPMNAVLGFAQVLWRDKALGPAQRDQLAAIVRGGEHLLGLINDALSIAQIEAGKAILHPGPFSVRRMLLGIEEMIRARAEVKGLRLDVTISVTLPHYVIGDEGKLRQILLNLLGNAAKFTSKGSVTLRVDWRDGVATFEVEDTGPGIPAEDLRHVFKPFYQAGDVVASTEGTGLGLAISSNYVAMMGGELHVRSAEGVGSAFTFQIPLAEAHQTPISLHRGRVVGIEPGQERFRILVTDDEWTNRAPLAAILSSLGFDMREAEDGSDAVRIWEEWRPHAIFMDVRMPVMDGWEATQQIRSAESKVESGRRAAAESKKLQSPDSAISTQQRPAARSSLSTQHCTIIAVSASAFDHDRERIIEAGADDFVAKPYREETIFEKLAEHLGVQFIVEERPEPRSEVAAEIVDDGAAAERLSALPADVVERLRASLTLGDLGAIGKVLADIQSIDESLSETLGSRVRRYEFDEMLALLEPARQGLPRDGA
jgi:signal transduction histidine kinase/CheY-like chemotaxis protein